jgi:hypothetical protein
VATLLTGACTSPGLSSSTSDDPSTGSTTGGTGSGESTASGSASTSASTGDETTGGETTGSGSSSVSATSDETSSSSASSSDTAGTTDTSGPGSGTDTDTSGTVPCDPACDPASDTPICAEDGICVPCSVGSECAAVDTSNPACHADGRCVQCTDSDTTACDGSDTPVCHPDLLQCVGCNDSTDCTASPSLSRCDGNTCGACLDDDDCTHLTGTQVCDDGICVECTPDDDSACGGKVCDVGASTCTNRDKASKGLCEDCVASSECTAGNVCVMTRFEDSQNVVQDAGFFCQEVMASSCPRPYAGVEPLTTVEGDPSTVCTLRVTTCTAYDQFSEQTCSADGADDECGDPRFDDGYCRPYPANPGTFRCTTPCGSDDDCKLNFDSLRANIS